MFKRIIVAAVVLGLVGLGVFYWITIPATLAAADLPDHEPDLVNGEYMFFAGGCASCHAAKGAKGEDKKKLVGGLALPSPFGTFYAPNISPDPESGIGGWSDLDFVNAVLRGVSPDGAHYYPSFPYTSYQRMKVEDVIDLKAFIDTLPAVKSEIQGHDLPFPFNIRRSLGGWKFLYVDQKPFTPPAGADEDTARGAYLVQGPGHCGECHTPRDFLGGPDSSRPYAGAPNPEGEGFVPNITPHESGIGSWSAADIASSLNDGFTPEYDSFGGSMVSVQENMAKLSDADRLAIGKYLKSITPIETKKP